MHSSTSNSDFPLDRVPAGASTLWIAVACAIIVLLSSEIFWRSRGHIPTAVDSKQKWSTHRERVSETSKQQVVVVGSSYMQMGFSTDTFRKMHPDTQLTQLAISGGGNALPVLRDLAMDASFQGIVICALREAWLRSTDGLEQKSYVDYYRKKYTSADRVECNLRDSISCRSVVLSASEVRPDSVVRMLAEGRGLPTPSYLTLQADRRLLADYSKTSADDIRRKLYQSKNSPSRREQDSLVSSSEIVDLNPCIERIKRRGGAVIFVKMPIASYVRPFADQKTSGSPIWRQFSESTLAVTINSRDHTRFDALEFLDPHHLDFRQASVFTEELLSLLDELKIVPIKQR